MSAQSEISPPRTAPCPYRPVGFIGAFLCRFGERLGLLAGSRPRQEAAQALWQESLDTMRSRQLPAELARQSADHRRIADDFDRLRQVILDRSSCTSLWVTVAWGGGCSLQPSPQFAQRVYGRSTLGSSPIKWILPRGIIPFSCPDKNGDGARMQEIPDRSQVPFTACPPGPSLLRFSLAGCALGWVWRLGAREFGLGDLLGIGIQLYHASHWSTALGLFHEDSPAKKLSHLDTDTPRTFSANISAI